jgi:hypothetical protein
MEHALSETGLRIRVIEDCLNGRRTAWEDPFKPGRNGLAGVEQRLGINSPLALLIVLDGVHLHAPEHVTLGAALRRSSMVCCQLSEEGG